MFDDQRPAHRPAPMSFAWMAAYVSLLRTILNRLYHSQHFPSFCTISSTSSWISAKENFSWFYVQTENGHSILDTHSGATYTDGMDIIGFRWNECFATFFKLLRWNQTSHFIVTNMFCLPPIWILHIYDLWDFNEFILTKYSVWDDSGEFTCKISPYWNFNPISLHGNNVSSSGS